MNFWFDDRNLKEFSITPNRVFHGWSNKKPDKPEPLHHLNELMQICLHSSQKCKNLPFFARFKTEHTQQKFPASRRKINVS